jgi:NAD(P)-dependent dehydrogenase (short-subunit alcohol dehydrogenase family)
MTDLADRVVMVTGASGNLGQAVARAFLAAGARLALAERGGDRLAELFPDLISSSEHLLSGGVDVTDPDSIQRWVDAVLTHFGRIDVLANTVGGYRAGMPVHETPLELWDAMLTLNARSVFLLSRAVVPAMLAQGSGRIIHTAARAALQGTANQAAYAVSKSAVVRLVESLAAETRQQGLTVNCLLPGTIDTPQNRASMPTADTSRWVTPESIADVFLFLASDAARDITGAAIPVYGRS